MRRFLKCLGEKKTLAGTGVIAHPSNMKNVGSIPQRSSYQLPYEPPPTLAEWDINTSKKEKRRPSHAVQHSSPPDQKPASPHTHRATPNAPRLPSLLIADPSHLDPTNSRSVSSLDRQLPSQSAIPIRRTLPPNRRIPTQRRNTQRRQVPPRQPRTIRAAAAFMKRRRQIHAAALNVFIFVVFIRDMGDRNSSRRGIVDRLSGAGLNVVGSVFAFVAARRVARMAMGH
jgi:hypothetical protein